MFRYKTVSKGLVRIFLSRVKILLDWGTCSFELFLGNRFIINRKKKILYLFWSKNYLPKSPKTALLRRFVFVDEENINIFTILPRFPTPHFPYVPLSPKL